jgi:hypothetical protein
MRTCFVCLLHWDANITFIARVREQTHKKKNRCEGKYDTTLKQIHEGGTVSLLKICFNLELMDAERNRPCHNHVSRYVFRNLKYIVHAKQST